MDSKDDGKNGQTHPFSLSLQSAVVSCGLVVSVVLISHIALG